MRADRLIPRTAWFLALLLGQASTLLGLMISLGWAFAFALIVPQAARGLGSGPQASLPVGPPLIGLALGGLGLLIARWGRQPVARFSVAGLCFNALPLALAIVLILIHAAR